MCIIFYTLGVNDYPIILAANRDEFLARPTSSISWHNFSPDLSTHSHEANSMNNTLSGLDLEGGGTWLGISILSPPLSSSTSSTSTSTSQPFPLLRFSTLTNFTEMSTPGIKPSRGFLVKEFLSPSSSSSSFSPSSTDSKMSLNDYLALVESKKQEYAGFNLLVGEFLSDGTFSMGYASNREKDLNSRILNPVVVKEGEGESAEKVIGLSNSTVRMKKGSGWPKVESGIEGFEKAILSNSSSKENEEEKEEKDLVQGLWDVLSAANPTPITERSHLRHTVLVRPIFFDPKASLPSTIPPLTPSPDPKPNTYLPHELPPIETLELEGTNNGHWYATRVQTILMIQKEPLSPEGEEQGKGKFRVTMRERDAYVLDLESKKPKWSGQERVFQFSI